MISIEHRPLRKGDLLKFESAPNDLVLYLGNYVYYDMTEGCFGMVTDYSEREFDRNTINNYWKHGIILVE